jgi:hypothetical protein
MPDLFPEVPLEQQIACVEREIKMRERVYPNFVANKRMTQDRADYEIRAMNHVRETLLQQRGTRK